MFHITSEMTFVADTVNQPSCLSSAHEGSSLKHESYTEATFIMAINTNNRMTDYKLGSND